MNKKIRYIIPNILTLTSLSIGIISITYAMKGKIHTGAWLAFLSMLLDRFDGMTARKLGASSSFGLEIDSLADIVAFGVTPAILLFTAVSAGSPHFRTGVLQVVPVGISVLWVVASCLRLTKYNIVAQAGEFDDVFQGFPMPIAAGFVLSPMLLLLKYFPESGYTTSFYDPRFLPMLKNNNGHWLFTVLAIWGALIAIGMLSPLKVPKFKPPEIKWKRIYLAVHAFTLYFMFVIRALPEFIMISALEFLVISIIFHFTDKKTKDMKYIPITDVMQWKIETRRTED